MMDCFDGQQSKLLRMQQIRCLFAALRTRMYSMGKLKDVPSSGKLLNLRAHYRHFSERS